jgi:hypothetical protein
MVESSRESSPMAIRSLRGVPFLAVVLCFFLPFFSVSSCEAGTDTEAAGFDIVTGSRLIQHQVDQPLYLSEWDGEPAPPQPDVPLGPIGPDPAAQKAADAARPWMLLTLVAVLVGGGLVLTRTRHWRYVRAVAAGLGMTAWVAAALAVEAAAPNDSYSNYSLSLESGFILALVTLIATLGWAVWSIVDAHNADTGGALGPPNLHKAS